MDDLRKVKRAIGITGRKALSRRNGSRGTPARRRGTRLAARCGAPPATERKRAPRCPAAPLRQSGKRPVLRERVPGSLPCYFFGASAGAGAAGAAAALSAGAAAGGGGGGGGASSFFAQADRTIVPANSSPKNSDTYLRIGSHSFPFRVYPFPDNGWGTYAAKYSTSKKRCNHFFWVPGDCPGGPARPPTPAAQRSPNRVSTRRPSSPSEK